MSITYEILTNKYKTLGFNTIGSHLRELIELAEAQEMSLFQFANLIADKEINTRNENKKKLYLKKARFPKIKTIEEFNFSYQTTITKKQINALLDFNWIDNRENLVFFGPSGIGKSHLATAIGVRAIDKGYKVIFLNSQGLVEYLDLAAIQNKLKERIRFLGKYDVVICDEMGYLPWQKKSVFNFFQLINTLYEYRSIIITTNKPFSEWGEFFIDETAATAVIDRIIHHCHIFPMNGESYRLRNQVDRQTRGNNQTSAKEEDTLNK